MDTVDSPFGKLTKQQEEVAYLVSKKAQEMGVDPGLALAVAWAESRFGKNVGPSRAGALGIMQVMPENAKGLGISVPDLEDNEKNVNAGLTILKNSLNRFGGNEILGVAGYNTRWNTGKKFAETLNPDDLPKETRDYLDFIDSFRPLQTQPVQQQPEQRQPAEPTEEPPRPAVSRPAPTDEQPLSPVDVSETQQAIMNVQQQQEEQTKEGGGLPSMAPFVYGLGGGALAGEVGALVSSDPRAASAAKVARAQEKLAAAKDKLTIAQQMSGKGPIGAMGFSDDLRPLGMAGSIEDLQNEYKAAQSALEAAKQEAAALSAKPPSAASIPSPDGGLPSRTVPGASGAQNWARAMASQQLPEAIVEQVDTMRKTGPGGAQRLIDEDLARMQKIKELGGGQYKLAGEGRGQLMLPPEEAARLEAQAAAKTSQQSAQQAEAARIAEQRRLAAQGKVRETGQQFTEINQKLKEAQRLKGLEDKARANMSLAQSALDRAKEAKPGMLERLGYATGTGKFLSPVLGALGGLGTALSADELLRQIELGKKTGDYSGAILPGLETTFGAMSLAPPVTPLTAAIKGIGMVGGLGLAGYELGRSGFDTLNNLYQEQTKKLQFGK